MKIFQNPNSRPRNVMTALAVAVILLGGVVFAVRSCAAGSDKAADKTAAANPSTQVVETGWAQRCSPADKDKKDEKPHCEVFDRLEMKENHNRVAEFAVGFGKEGDTKAQGVVVLPLGIVLEDGVAMKIDDSKSPYLFKVKYCVSAGCLSYVDLDQAVIDSLKKGTTVHFMFGLFNGQKVDIDLKLADFGKELKKLP